MRAAAGQGSARLDSKFVGAEQALAAIAPGSRIYLGTGCAAPRTLLATLETMDPGPADLEFVSFLTTSAVSGTATASDTHYRHRAFFVGSDVRGLAATGRLDYVPIKLEDVPALLASGRLSIDVALLQVSPPDARGFVSLGVSVDGSTLQIGLGRVPHEALGYLKDRRDLGIHSDVITDGVVDLVEAGVVTGHRKSRHPDRIVTSYCLGTRRLYDFVNDNPCFDFLPIEQVQMLCNVNHETQVAFLALTGPRENEVVVGSDCYFLSPTTNLAEVGYMVAPEGQGAGLGTALQARLQDYAVSLGVRGFIAEILPNNARMLRLATRSPGMVTTTRDEYSIQVTILFEGSESAGVPGEDA